MRNKNDENEQNNRNDGNNGNQTIDAFDVSIFGVSRRVCCMAHALTCVNLHEKSFGGEKSAKSDSKGKEVMEEMERKKLEQRIKLIEMT